MRVDSGPVPSDRFWGVGDLGWVPGAGDRLLLRGGPGLKSLVGDELREDLAERWLALDLSERWPSVDSSVDVFGASVVGSRWMGEGSREGLGPPPSWEAAPPPPGVLPTSDMTPLPPGAVVLFLPVLLLRPRLAVRIEDSAHSFLATPERARPDIVMPSSTLAFSMFVSTKLRFLCTVS